jgi:hypothetical protein
VAVWLCGFVAVWLCGFVAVWLGVSGWVAVGARMAVRMSLEWRGLEQY